MSLFGDIASGLGSLFGGSTGTVLGGLGSLAGAGYDIYQGIQSQEQQQDYMNQLLASQTAAGALTAEQAARARQLYYPIEDLQAKYALADLKQTRPLQVAQRRYGTGRGMEDIAFAQDVIDPTRYNLVEFLAQGVDPQEYMDIASADVTQAYDEAQAAQQRALARQGVNPASGASQSLANQLAISRAAQLAGARTEASRLAEDVSLQRKGQALDYWQGIPFASQQAPQSGTQVAQQAAQGFRQAASGLLGGAQLAGQQAKQGFTGASALLNQMGQYFQPQSGTTSPGLPSSGGINPAVNQSIYGNAGRFYG